MNIDRPIKMNSKSVRVKGGEIESRQAFGRNRRSLIVKWRIGFCFPDANVLNSMPI